MPGERAFSPAEMALRGRIGAYALHARRDPKETTHAARTAFMARFEREVDPDSILEPTERVRRAEAARKAYFSRLALKSAQARRGTATRVRRSTSSGIDMAARKAPSPGQNDA